VTACHAGPPVALMVRAVEALVPNQQLARLTVELIRPIPMAGFRVQAEVRRPGRSVTHTEAEIYDDDRFYARAYGMHIRTVEDAGWGEAVLDGRVFPESVPGPFPLADSAHSEEWFGGSVECRYDVAGSVAVGGPTTIWMKTQHPIVADEAPSPFQRIAPLSDCGNGISYNATVEATSL
jgi:hypothetical protein